MKLFKILYIPVIVFAKEFGNFKQSLSENTKYREEMKQSLRELNSIIQQTPEGEVNAIKRISFNMTGLLPLDPPKPNFKKIEYLSHYAGAAYCIKWKLQGWQCSHCVQLGIDIQLVDVFEDPPTGGLSYIAVDNKKKTIALVFRGSSNVKNWVLNFSLEQVPYADAGEKALVHSGFLKYVRALKPFFVPLIKSLIIKFPEYQITVIGHSLGGAVATLAVAELKLVLNVPWSKFDLYTYGEPRVGNSVFSIWLNHNLANQFRVVSEYDPVPTVPFSYHNYTHHQREFFVKGDKITACSVSDIYLEDASCAPDIKKLDIMYHITYFGQIMGLGC